jgi:tetratricopeptide (TPR) repeat protein
MRWIQYLWGSAGASRTAQTSKVLRSRNTSAHRDGAALPTITLACLLSILSTATAAIPPVEFAAIDAELHQPIAVHLMNGRTIPGHSIDVTADQLLVATSEGAGEIIYTFNLDEVRDFTIPGESYKTLAVEWMEAGEPENAMELMQMLYLQRVKIIPLLPASESHFFTYYVDLILQSDNPARAIAVTQVLKPQISNPAALRALDDAVLDSYNSLQLYDEARPLTLAWLAERDPYGDSALGYYTYGADLLRSEQYEAALDSALQPIVFSTPNPPDKLAECYAVAISAALGLRDKAYALTLYEEMQERALAWPNQDPTFDTAFKQLNAYLEKTNSEATDTNPTSL